MTYAAEVMIPERRKDIFSCAVVAARDGLMHLLLLLPITMTASDGVVAPAAQGSLTGLGEVRTCFSTQTGKHNTER
jgi:hypothetical protein